VTTKKCIKKTASKHDRLNTSITGSVVPGEYASSDNNRPNNNHVSYGGSNKGMCVVCIHVVGVHWEMSISWLNDTVNR